MISVQRLYNLRIFSFVFLVLLVTSGVLLVSASSNPLEGTTVTPQAGPSVDGDLPSKSASVLERAASAALARTSLIFGPKEKSDEESVPDKLSTPPAIELRPRSVTLNVMVAGLSGLGKTTTCQSLLGLWEDGDASVSGSESAGVPTVLTRNVDVKRRFERYDPETNAVLRVRIIDTPGFGNRVNHRDAVRPISRYIAACRRRQYRAENSIRLPTDDAIACDDLVHVCLYFLSPGRFLQIDRHFLRKIQKEICIVPIIAKADTMTDGELAAYRSDILRAFEREGLFPYDFDSEGTAPYRRGRRAGEPLAIVSRGGKYPWGRVSASDPAHSDLLLVRDLLLSRHTERLVELARAKYGAYRASKIRCSRIGEAARYAVVAGLTANLFVPGVIVTAAGKVRVISAGTWSRLVGIILGAVGGSRKGGMVEEVEDLTLNSQATIIAVDEDPSEEQISWNPFRLFSSRKQGYGSANVKEPVNSEVELKEQHLQRVESDSMAKRPWYLWPITSQEKR